MFIKQKKKKLKNKLLQHLSELLYFLYVQILNQHN